MTCSDTPLDCNNLFYVQTGKVTRYAPTGNYYADNSVRPRLAICRRERVGDKPAVHR